MDEFSARDGPICAQRQEPHVASVLSKACCAWLGATLANTVSIPACHIKEIYVAWASAKQANMLCFSNSEKSVSSVIYSGNNTQPLLVLGCFTCHPSSVGCASGRAVCCVGEPL